jgi:hypothetical protein
LSGLLFNDLWRIGSGAWGARRRPPQLISGNAVAIVLTGHLARNLAQIPRPFHAANALSEVHAVNRP